MGSDLYRSYIAARELFGRADDFLGVSLSHLCFEGPCQELNSDLNAQLAVYTVSCIVTELLKINGVLPDVVSGYSSGFYAAAYAAGCFDFERGLGIVRSAGNILLDQGKKIDGCMAVIFGLPPEKVVDICKRAGEAEVAILNTPRQTVISGVRTAVHAAIDISLKDGALDAYILPAATAYHSSFVSPAAIPFLDGMEHEWFMDPKVCLMSYLSLQCVSDRQDLLRVMADQLAGTVRWSDLLRQLSSQNHCFFIEVGPGAVISRAARWIDRDIKVQTTTPKINMLNAIVDSRRFNMGRN
jgi:[acyl-carrier-protein] S-malonyltransferase